MGIPRVGCLGLARARVRGRGTGIGRRGRHRGGTVRPVSTVGALERGRVERRATGRRRARRPDPSARRSCRGDRGRRTRAAVPQRRVSPAPVRSAAFRGGARGRLRGDPARPAPRVARRAPHRRCEPRHRARRTADPLAWAHARASFGAGVRRRRGTSVDRRPAAPAAAGHGAHVVLRARRGPAAGRRLATGPALACRDRRLPGRGHAFRPSVRLDRRRPMDERPARSSGPPGRRRRAPWRSCSSRRAPARSAIERHPELPADVDRAHHGDRSADLHAVEPPAREPLVLDRERRHRLRAGKQPDRNRAVTKGAPPRS